MTRWKISRFKCVGQVPVLAAGNSDADHKMIWEFIIKSSAAAHSVPILVKFVLGFILDIFCFIRKHFPLAAQFHPVIALATRVADLGAHIETGPIEPSSNRGGF